MSLTADREADLRLALRAVADAGRAVMAAFRTEQEVRHKSPTQPVTDADLEADRLIAGILRGDRPDYGWLSEETADRPDRLERPRVWIVDPIDGTRSFIGGYAEFGISVGLAEEGEAVLGVVYNPATRELFWGARGHGSYRAVAWDGDVTAALDAPRLGGDRAGGDRRVLVASRSEIGYEELEPFRGDWEIRPLGSTAYKMAAVAAGVGGGMVSRGPKHEWDLAGAAVVLEEAGVRVSDLRGERLVFNRPDPFVHGLVVAVPELYDELLERARVLPAPRLEPGFDPADGSGDSES